MKSRIIILIAMSLVFLIDQSNAGCGGTDSWSHQYGYQHTQSNECECTDTGWKYNECISKSTFCEAFGNIGAS